MPIQLSNKGGKDFDPVPSGVHHAICYGVVDVGTQEGKQYGPKQKLVILFELPFERIDIPDRGNLPRGISMTQTASLGDKANLRKLLASWRGRDFTTEELAGFDPKKLVGANCQINVVHEKKNDKTYANIASIIPLSKGTPTRKAENPEVYFSLTDQPDLKNIKFPPTLPNWIQKMIQFSAEVVEAHEGPSQAANPPPAPATQENLDEDVPF